MIKPIELSTIDAAVGLDEFIVSSVLKSASIVGNSERQHDTEGDIDVLAKIELRPANAENPVSEECLAGWLAKKCHSSHTIANNSLDISLWVQHLSYSGLFEPSPSFLEIVQDMETIFQRCLGPTFRIKHRITTKKNHHFNR
ncbi:hypothetical protein PR048_016322, partial [Dryococelus australis]